MGLSGSTNSNGPRARLDACSRSSARLSLLNKAGTSRKGHIWSFLRWLSSTHDPDDVLLGTFPQELRADIQKIFADTRADYDTEQLGPIGHPGNSAEPIVRATFDDVQRPIPEWLIRQSMRPDSVQGAPTPTLYDQMTRNQRPVISDLNRPSVYNISEPIRELMYSLVLGPGHQGGEIGRKGCGTEIVGRMVCTLSSPLPPIEELPGLSAAQKLAILGHHYQRWMEGFDTHRFRWENMVWKHPNKWPGAELLWLSPIQTLIYRQHGHPSREIMVISTIM